MSSQPAASPSALLATLGDFRWVRAHVSFYAVGTVVLVGFNLITGGTRLWSLTAVGIWSMLLLVHLILIAIARLSIELMADDDEEVVLLPIRDAVIVDPPSPPDPAATWTPGQQARSDSSQNAGNGEKVSWQIATDTAQVKKRTQNDTEAETP